MSETLSKTSGGGSAIEGGALVNSKVDGRFRGTGDLTSQQRKLVKAIVQNGGNVSAAGRTAGYASDSGPWEALKAPSVRAAIKIEREKLVEIQGASLGIKTVMDIAGDDEAPKAVRLKAGMWLYELSHPKAVAALPGASDKGLHEMTMDELQAFVKQGKATLEGIEQAAAKVIDIPHATVTPAPSSGDTGHDASGEAAP